MSKKDYEMIAGEIRKVRELVTSPVAISTVERIVENLSRAFSEDNARFNPRIFRDACESWDV